MLRVIFLCVALLGAEARVLLATDHLSQPKGDSNVRFPAHPSPVTLLSLLVRTYGTQPSHTLRCCYLFLPRLCALPTGLGAGYAKVPGCFVVDPPWALGEYRLLERGRCRDAHVAMKGCGTRAEKDLCTDWCVRVCVCVLECVQHDDAQMPRGTTSAGKEDGEGW